MNYKKSVLLGLSGGIDSAYSAYLLKKQGFDITGVYLKMHGLADETDAVAVAQNLDIPIKIADCREDFRKYVIEYFIDEYSNGRTPNPCVICNRYVKIAKLIEIADSLGIDYISTGHYVKIKQNKDTGKYYICRATDEKKDQSYFLWKLTESQLSRFIPPLASYEKEYIKDDAVKQSVLTRILDESQEICFIPDNDYKSYIESVRGKYSEGNFISKDGKVLGTHKGIIYYTIGQRKKLGIALGTPYIVTEINAKDNTVTIEPAESGSGFRQSFEINCLNFGYMSECDIKYRRQAKFYAKIRCAARFISCAVELADSGSAVIYLDEPAKAVTPGQSCVVYTHDSDGELCVAFGGIIK